MSFYRQPLFALLMPILAYSLALPSFAGPTKLHYAKDKLQAIDACIQNAVDNRHIPGAVVWIESQGQTYTRAFGNRVTYPWAEHEPMTLDTVFDLASLTKVMATAPAILQLYEQGDLDLSAPVHQYLPEFLAGGIHSQATDPGLIAEDRETVLVKHLLTHQSGLPPGISLMTKEFYGYQEGVRRATSIGLVERPQTRFRYSDVNYILLGEIVRRLSGQSLDEYVVDHIYTPLGMTNTTYLPDWGVGKTSAPTTHIRGFGSIRGEVHDPTCRRMGGVAGHAGLFSTAEDIAKFCRMYLKGGICDEVADPQLRVLKQETIEFSTQSHTPLIPGISRGLGWDKTSHLAYHRGDNFPTSGYGHTGWTGTSIWIDPGSQTFVILLANRNHPSESGKIKRLRMQVASLAAQAVGYYHKAPKYGYQPLADEFSHQQTAAGAERGQVRNGIDVLEQKNFAPLDGLKIGLITNHTGTNRIRRSTIDLLAEAPNTSLVALFAPEHGIRGAAAAGESVSDDRDSRTGLPIHSLYKTESRKPTAEQLVGIDALVFDIQDIGCRFYTYISTMGLAMEAANQHGKKFIVLDRVNPIGGSIFDGPVREGEGNNFVAYHDLPVIHGMTVGELAQMFKVERGLTSLDLEVIPVEGWNPAMRFDETGLPWINPSPNIRSLSEALLYPGIGLLEFCNLSVGRGTSTPFEVVGAPWITEGRMAARLDAEKLKGIQFIPIRFTPTASKYKNEDCGGVRMFITDRDLMNPIDVGLAIGRAILADYPITFDLSKNGNILLRHPLTLQKWLAGDSTKSIRRSWSKQIKQFKNRRQSFLIYTR